MKPEVFKAIPYGVSDFSVIRDRHFYYVDKTPYIKEIEETGLYHFFIRPRRFGKSLMLSMLKYYYDASYIDQFERLFKGTWIYDNPTKERGKYLVLSLNFSAVTPSRELLEQSFLEYIRKRVLLFAARHADRLGTQSDYFSKQIETAGSPADILTTVLSVCEMAGQKMYVIIDEYDNFANTILTASGDEAYHDLTHGDGFLRAFFNILKSGTGDTDSPLSRLFITGVSPITMDDVTSGFNIGKNVSLLSGLNGMLGFTEDDVKTMIDYYSKHFSALNETPLLMDMLKRWYGNYRFSDTDAPPLFNTDMILYFVDSYLQENKMPKDLIDNNVKIDYGKLRHLIIIDRDKNKPPTTNGNFSKLKEIMATGGTVSKISKGFPLKQLIETNNFKSLLYYFGLLTIDAWERGRYRLQIPNETVKRLYYDYIESAYRETGVFSIDLSVYADLIGDMAYDGIWRPLLEFITARMKESLSLRDLITGEKAVQTFLNVYLGFSDFFIVHTEKEMNNGYADIIMAPHTAKYPELKHAFLLELKYVNAGIKPGSAKCTQLAAEAREQVKNYALDEKFVKTIGNAQLVKLVLIFSGHEIIYLDEVATP